MPRLKPIRGTLIRASHPLARGLTGCWLLSEGTGEIVADLGPFRQDGSFYGGSPLWKPGRHGYCLQFDGTDECIDCGTGKFGWDITNELSVIALVNHEASQVNTIFARSAYARPVRLYSQTGGRFTWRVYTDIANNCTINSTSPHATDGSEWVHVAGTWKPYGAYLYVNGVQEASDTATNGNLNIIDNQFVGIGGTYESSGFLCCWTGGIEYVFIYNRALRAEEIKWLYREPFAIFDNSVNSAPVHAPTSIVSLAGSVDATSEASARMESINSSTQITLTWRNDALFNGMTANASKLGTTLSLGWFWSRVKGCSVLYRGTGMERIDFTNILAVADSDVAAISPPDYTTHESDTTYFYVIRRFNHCGNWELTLSAAVKVSIDTNGELLKPHPNKIFALKAKQANGERAHLVWFYCPLEQESSPVCFKVYSDNGTGQIDDETALATIEYEGQKFYSYTSNTLQTGKYLFAVKAEDTDGGQHGSTTELTIEIDGDTPDGIDILTVEKA